MSYKILKEGGDALLKEDGGYILLEAIELALTEGLKGGDSPSAAMTASPIVTEGFKGGDVPGGVYAVLITDALKLGEGTAGGDATEEQTTENGDFFLNSGMNIRVGQRLTINNRTLSKLSFKLKKTGSPTGNVTFLMRFY